MAKAAVSVTLTRDNIAWLEAHARRTRARSFSQALDDLVTAVRTTPAPEPILPIIGAIAIADDDPDLSGADAAVAGLFRHSHTPGRARETRRRRHSRGRQRA